ncbi:hypothetical protein NQ314_002892 [Rhamnusium bicolor]|uniref:PiggyBac transposable element-derived protein domain-containing protein n=1 Tax=Rhamnusium bicolor TaxID=1586634 RepID=A0AAV8ZNG7_9CUCU|nr:hypothetical protein NQ314_002892 [Rhamnusium bicolor]
MGSDKDDVSSVSDRESDEYELTGGSNIEDDLETSGSEYDDGEIEYEEVSSDNENGELVENVRVWCEIRENTPAPPEYPFTENVGVTFPTAGDENKLFFFKKLVDDQLINTITEETNRFALQTLAKKCSKLCGSKLDSTMSCKRFENIKQFLHFSNNETYDPERHPNPKLNKIFLIYDMLVKKFRDFVVPDKHITIDESLLLYKGRLRWIQYIPLKRARFGIKHTCCARTMLDSDYDHLRLVSSKVVMSLTKPLLGKGYCLTMDNFHNTPQLADLPIQNKTDVYGTLLLRRKEVPKELKKRYMSGKLLAIKEEMSSL